MKTNSALIKLLLIAMGILSHPQHSHAQSSPIFKLPAYTSATNTTWWDSIYRFPEFQYGRITFAAGFSPVDSFKLNYNLYFAQVDFIGEKGDTLQIKPSSELKMVDIGGHLFYHDDRQGYIEILFQAPISLGVWTILSAVKTDRRKQYPNTITTIPDVGYGDVDIRGRISTYDRYYRKGEAYFFIDQTNKLYKAIKPSVLKLFSAHKKEIKAYMLETNIDFTSYEDLVALLNFCAELR